VSGLLGEIGTIEWARRSRGILGRGERARFFAAVVLRTARATPRLLAARAGGGGSGPDPSRLSPPDSAFAREVVELCAELEPMVVEHSYRSYLFARALGHAEGLDCDEEALFAATMLHDLGFRRIEEIEDRCFTLAAAEAAAGLLAGSPLPPALQHDVLDAITLHLNPAVPRRQGAVQHLAHDGILLDVLGVRAGELERAGMRRVRERHPGHGFTVRAAPLLRAHGRRVAGCRAGVLFRAGFGRALALGPWHGLDRAEAAPAPAADPS
jgi:HD domain